MNDGWVEALCRFYFLVQAFLDLMPISYDIFFLLPWIKVMYY